MSPHLRFNNFLINTIGVMYVIKPIAPVFPLCADVSRSTFSVDVHFVAVNQKRCTWRVNPSPQPRCYIVAKITATYVAHPTWKCVYYAHIKYKNPFRMTDILWEMQFNIPWMHFDYIGPGKLIAWLPIELHPNGAFRAFCVIITVISHSTTKAYKPNSGGWRYISFMCIQWIYQRDAK